MSAALQHPSGALTFSALYDETVDVAWRVLARLGVGSADLPDAVQDVFVIAHRRLDDFRTDARASTWITGIAIRVASDHRRRVSRRPTEPMEPHARTLADDQHRPDEHAARSEAAQALSRVLAQLDPTQREVFVLAELEQLSAPDIVELTGAPLNTVYSRLRLARAHFNELVQALHRSAP